MTPAPDADWRALLPPLALTGVLPAAERWQAERPVFGGRVEVEVAGPDLTAWFVETRALAQLQHPAIPPLHEVGVLPDGRIARIRAAVTGVRWAEAAPTHGERFRADTSIRAAEALAHAHARGVVHGRFGEEALRLGERGQVWVVGWGAPDEGALLEVAPLDAGRVERDVAALSSLVDAWLGPAALGEVGARAPLETAEAIAARLQGWLDGADRRGRALGWVSRAEALLEAGAAATSDHAAAERVARFAVAAAPTYEPEVTRHPVWALADAAEQLRRAGVDRNEAARRALHAALEQDPALPEAHVAMVRLSRAAAAQAQRAGAAGAEARAELALREHVRRIPTTHPLRARGDRFLRGTGAITLVTDPPGALVTVERYEEIDHRLVPRPAGSLGHTPLHAVDLAPGSYRLRLEAPGRAPTLYPVHIGRNEHWGGVPPGETTPFPIRLLPSEALGPDDCYVPAGWSAAGAHSVSRSVWPRSLWCDGFVMRRFPVTALDLLTWLDALLDAGEEDPVLALAPRMEARLGVRRLYYPRGEDGRFCTALPRAEADWPALYVSYATAVAYAHALRATHALGSEGGRPWRLPMDLEWEKAARGVDGRAFPWGRRESSRWANFTGPDRFGAPVSVRSFPLDESPYGVRGVAGNASDWVADPYELLGPELPDDRVQVVDPTPVGHAAAVGICRGSRFPATPIHLAHRMNADTDRPRRAVGFRLARSVGG